VSLIAGIVRWDGAPLDPAVIRRMSERFGSRAPEGASTWCHGSAALIHGSLRVTPEQEVQPVVDTRAALAGVFDGRLDNRAELMDALELDAETGDATLVLRAHQKWGEGAVERLLGDFAFCVWEHERRRLLCVRDHMGARPLLYREGRGWLAWASALDVLAAGIDPMPPPNEGMVGEYLAGIITDKRETLFRDIYRVPPAHVLSAADGAIQLRRYWTPDPTRTIRYKQDREYEDHLAELMGSVVRARLRTHQPVGVMLSGGVDSSSVTGIAATLLHQRSIPAAGVETFSISVPGPDDERPFFEQVVERWRLPAHHLTATLPRAGQFREEISQDLEVQTFPHAPTLDPMRALARDRGIRVMLTGMGGDDWLGSSRRAYADLLKRGRVVALARRLHEERGAEGFPGWEATAHAAVWPFVPAPVQRAVRRLLRRDPCPAWIDPAFAARISLPDRLAKHRVDIPFATHEQYDLWHEGASGMMVYSYETATRSSARFGVQHWHPYLDRRIVEFGLALPADQRWRAGRDKDLLRRAMASYLPPAVADRRTNPHADHVFVQAIDAEGGLDAFDASALARLGWVHLPALHRLNADLRERYRTGAPYGFQGWVLWQALAMSLWMDAINVVE